MPPPALAAVAAVPPQGSPVRSLALCPSDPPVLFTGHEDGVVFCWDTAPQLVPYGFLLGHTAAVVSVVVQSTRRVVRPCSRAATQTPAHCPPTHTQVTGSSDAVVRSWSVPTGECLAHNALQNASRLRVLAVTSRHVVVACEFGVTLLDAESLVVTGHVKATPQLLRAPLTALVCTSAADDTASRSASSSTLTALASVRREEGREVLLVGVDTSGSAWRWRGSPQSEAPGLDGDTGRGTSTAVSQVALLGWTRESSDDGDDAAMPAPSGAAAAAAASHRGPACANVSADGKCALLVSAAGWAVVPTQSGPEAAANSVYGDGAFVGGAFVGGDAQRIALWSTAGDVRVCDVLLPAGSASRPKAPLPRERERDLFVSQPLGAPVSGVATCTSGRTAWLAAAAGATVALWALPEAPPRGPGTSPPVPPLARGCLSDGWPRGDRAPSTDDVCTSLVAGWPPMVVLGHASGVLHLVDVSTAQVRFTLPGHTGAVRCLAAWGALLLSGGDDATVRAWSLGRGEEGGPGQALRLLCVLRHHVAPVVALHTLGDAATFCMLSEAADGSVGVLHGEEAGAGHPPTCSVLLPAPPPGGAAPSARLTAALYMLSAGCVALRRGTSLEVWDAASGVLDRLVTGTAAADLLLARLTAAAQGDATHASRAAAKVRPVTGDCRVPWAPILQCDVAALTATDRDGLLSLLPVLHTWGWDAQVDAMLAAEAKLTEPPPPRGVAPALAGCKGAVSVLTPVGAAQRRMFTTSSRLVAQRSLAMTLLGRCLQRLGDNDKAAAAMLVAFYAVQLHSLPGVAPPAAAVYAACWQHANEHVREAARALLASAPEASVPAALRGDADFSWRAVEAACGGESEASAACTGRMGVLAAAGLAVASQRRSDGCALHPAAVARTLVSLRGLAHDAPAPHGSAAVALLGEGMAVWCDTLQGDRDRGAFALEALVLCERLAASTSSGLAATDVMVAREASADLLAALAVALPPVFLAALCARLAAGDSAAHMTAFLALIRVVQTQPAVLSPHLDRALEAICGACTPGPSGARRACATGANGALAEFAARLPAYVAHHRGSGRVAVAPTHGASAAPLVHVFELPHGLVRILDAGPGEPVGGECAALSIDGDGARVAAYHAASGMLRFWVLGPPGAAAWRAARGLPPARACAVPRLPQTAGGRPKFRLEWVSGLGAAAGVALLTATDPNPVCFLPVVAG